MSGKAIAGITGTLLALILCSVAGLSLAGGGLAMAACSAPGTAATPSGTTAPDGAWTSIGAWNSEQVKNAAAIVVVGQRLHVPPRGWVIAVATAMQEDRLLNDSGAGPQNDHDSVGLFQQRPSQGWGSSAQLLDPVYASTQFYQRLLSVAHWQNLPLAVAAQSVQRSAFPSAYGKWEYDAFTLVNRIGPRLSGLSARDFTAWLSTCSALGGDSGSTGSIPLPPGFTLPASTPTAVVTAIGWALAQRGTPYSFGGDCTDAHSGNPAHQCDCSSLIQQAYRNAGINLPRLAHLQAQAGTPVTSVAQLQPGDLIFIPGSDGTMSEPGHVGLYIGQGILIQAPHTGDVVKLARVSTWTSQIAAIRRIVNSIV